MIEVAALVLFFGVSAYAILGGADFGAGFWDLIAGGAARGARPRALASYSIGPVWEANHVWLIFCLVVLWTAFSEAFQSITLTLFVPLSLAAFRTEALTVVRLFLAPAPPAAGGVVRCNDQRAGHLTVR
jgi:cytochrome d ubiquinol oxidase subunit II